MSDTGSNRFLTTGIIILVLVILAGAAVAWLRYEPGDRVEIRSVSAREWAGTIYIGGSVRIPGYYPFNYDDSLESLVCSAGGITPGAEPDKITLLVPETGNDDLTQKIDINRAEPWLLEALPGIGETLAQRIVDYRAEHDRFNNILELLEVEGIGPGVYEEIREYITVAD